MRLGESHAGRRDLRVFDVPAEVLISSGRLILSLFALAAVYLDPTQPARYADLVAIGVWLHALVAVVWLLVTPQLQRRPGLQLLSHAVDVVAATALMSLTDGSTSPFFVFFTFILITATLRWNWRGAVVTAAVLVALFLGVLGAARDAALSGAHELNRTVVRLGYLLVAGAMLGYFGAHRERSRTRLAQLAEWPLEAAREARSPGAAALGRVASIMNAKGVLLLWEEDDEPVLKSAYWDGAAVSYVADDSILREFAPWHGHLEGRITADQVDPRIVARFPFRVCVIAPFELSLCSGCVLLLDPDRVADDEQILADLVAVRLGVEIEHDIVRNRLAMAAKVSERAKLARDLHDGLLQTLTASTLHLKMAAETAPEDLAKRLTAIREGLAEEQRVIRHFVEENRPRRRPAKIPLGSEIRARLRQLERDWSCVISYDEEPEGLEVPPDLSRHIRHIIAEAVANAARHGRARSIKVRAARVGEGLELTIADDGSGFPILAGDFKSTASGGHILPQSLQSRAADLGGDLSLMTDARGSTVRIHLPHA